MLEASIPEVGSFALENLVADLAKLLAMLDVNEKKDFYLF